MMGDYSQMTSSMKQENKPSPATGASWVGGSTRSVIPGDTPTNYYYFQFLYHLL